MLTILFYILIGILLFHALYYVVLYSNIAFNSSLKSKASEQPLPVSVVVYIKDNEADLPQFLEAMLAQDYTTYELVLVNNASEDESLEILEQFVAQHRLAKLVHVENNEAFWGNKKYALTLGIKRTSYDHLLFTEPKALPNSTQWIASMTALFTAKKEVVIAHTTIEKKKKSLSNKYARFQLFLKTLHNFVWVELGKPLYGNNLNQAYKKTLFYKVNGFIKEMKISQGEEQEFIRQIGKKSNTAFTIAPESINTLHQQVSWSSAFQLQKNNDLLWKRTGIFNQLKLRFYHFSVLAFYALLAFLLLHLYQWEIVLGLFVFRYIISIFYFAKILKNFNEKDLVWVFPFFEFTHILTGHYFAFKHFITRKKI
ncbi:glycosyltransferase [Myroides fluvii]|uniref:glycosyltransferase n=1 Tax=Myroides fluvii TaxID=2572594 RepID=UPI00131AAA38|nr:glycosyltransferase [Myroides fluvii]